MNRLAVVVFLFILLASGSLFAAPVISSLSPTSGASGTFVTITGSGFGATKGGSTVKIGGVIASTTSWSDPSIVATVPSGLANGLANVTVTVSGTTSNAVTFTVTNPVITSLSINSAPVDQAITINGANFGASQGINSTVTFNGTTGVPSYWSDTSIVVPVPIGATTGNLVVTVNGNSTPAVTFMVTPPTPQPAGVNFIQGDYLAPVNPAASIQVQFPVEQTQGHLNIVIVSWKSNVTPAVTVASVSDSAGNSYALAVGPTTSTNRTQAIYYAKNIAASASNTVTVRFSSSPTIPDVRIAEFSGLDVNNPIDVTAAATGTGTTADSGYATTTNPNDLLVAANEADSITTAPGTGYTNLVIVLHHSGDADILEDQIVTATGSYHATASISGSVAWVMQMIAFKEAPNQAPVVNAGPNQTITLPTNTVTLNGTATDDGLPKNTLTISWSKVSGPGTVTFTSPSTASTQATFSTYGTYVLQLTANDSQLSSSSNVTITVNSQPISLVLNPLSAGPDVTGTTQTMTAVLKNGTGPTSTPISGVSVSFTVTGANATSGNATTNATGTATFTYTGAHSGFDTVQASYTGQNSNSANVSWLVPAQPVSTTSVFGRFFTTNGSCSFNTPATATPAFTQAFPTINFNAPSGAVPGNNSGVNTNTRPFTDIATDQNGNFSGTIVAQGNGFQAGVGSMNSFQSAFTGSFTIPSAGNVTFNFFSDDGFIFGVGGGATRVSGVLVNPPSSNVTPFASLPVLGSYNQITFGGPSYFQVVVNFPAAGTYLFEADYTECAQGQITFTMTAGQGNGGNGTGVPPSGALLLTPVSPSSLATGQTQTFTALVTDATGTAVPNATVALNVNGANQRQLTATANSSGQATFSYTGTNAGTDAVQASTNLSGMGAYSNQVNMTWTVSGSATTFVPQGWIGSPIIGAVVQGQVPITVASGENLTSGTLTYWPTSNPAAVTTLNANTTGSGTIGTFDATVLASGGYTIQLNATDTNSKTQVSQITASVVGNNKPGRMTSTVTEFKVPLAGIPISITRTYDSLDRSKIEDFGFGWKLRTFVDLSVDSQNNVTLNFNGQKITFFFTPQPSSFFGSWLTPAYTPQAGVHGSLASNGCGGLMQLQSGLVCFPSTGQTYQPTVYAYTDPAGRTYTMTSTGQLQSIQDLNGNTLTVTPSGITSSVNGVVIPFVRDGSGRITQISDLSSPANNYTYSYDGNGNLQSVQYPGLTAAETYTYATDHSLKTETDPVGNTSSAAYYDSTNDGGQPLLDGRLKSVTGPTVSDVNGNPVQYTTQYAYTLSTNTTTITNPDGGVVTRADDSFGKPLTITEPVNGSTSRTTTYQYDLNENLVKMIRPCGNASCSDTTGNDTWTYTYDANGFQTSVQDPLGHKSTKTYNPFGGVLTATDAANTNTQTTTYDANFNPSQTTDLLNGTGTFVSSSTYDALGDLQTSTDANSKTTQYGYDPKGNLIQVTDPLNEVTRYGYDLMDRLTSQTDPLSNTTTFTYDALGRLKTRTDALNKTTTYGYDNNGNKTSETDAFTPPRTTTYHYDAMNRLDKTTYPDSSIKTFTYDFRGNKTSETDQSGHVTRYAYDLAGQLLTVTYAYGTSPPDLGTVNYSYDLDGRVQTTTDELNNVTTNGYDAAGNLTSVKNAFTPPGTTNYGYDADNRKSSVQDANGNTTGYAYDVRGRLQTITYPATATQPITTTGYTYDGMGRVLTTTDQAGKVMTKTYDAVGRLTSVADAIRPTPNTTNYFYDLAGNLRFLQDAAGRVTSYQYDTLNRRAVRTLPLNQLEIYTYDAVGNLATKTDFNGLKTTYAYDTLNRLLSKTPQTGTAISFTYTPTGKRLSMTDPSGTTNYPAYDNRDRLKTKATPEGTLTYTYDAHSNLLTIASSNTNGASMTYTYDALNRLASAKDNRIAAQGGPSTPTTYSYDPAGNLTGYAYPNTVQTANAFDTLNRLTQTCEATTSPACSAGTKLASYAYTLGNAGNRTNVLELNSRNVAYGYDNDYRLASEAITADPSGNNGTVNYVYDVVGNRFSMTSTLNAVPGGSFFYDNNDQLTTDIYDANGNTKSFAGTTINYDFENRMTQYGANVLLTYDGDGNRVSETAVGVTTKFLVDDYNPTGLPQVLDELVSGSVTRTYAYGLQRISENQLVGGTWTPNFYGYDGHGNVRFLTNAAGTVTDSYDYDAFGMPIRTSGTTSNSFHYSGERLDSSIGLYDLRARYYNQATGRFWARDPEEHKCCGCCGLKLTNAYIYSKGRFWATHSWNEDGCRPLSVHAYLYSLDDPVDRLDPTGREAITEYELNQQVPEKQEAVLEIGEKGELESCIKLCKIACKLLNFQLPNPSPQAVLTCQAGCDYACRVITN